MVMVAGINVVELLQVPCSCMDNVTPGYLGLHSLAIWHPRRKSSNMVNFRVENA